MAAGLGTRLQPFTSAETKALLPVLGIPIAQYSLDALQTAGVQTVIANIHHRAVQARAGLLALDYQGMDLHVSDESSLLLGSAGALKKAENQLGKDPFFLANADVISTMNWRELALCHQRLRKKAGVQVTLGVFQHGAQSSPRGAYREVFFNPQTSLITGLGGLEVGRPFFMGAAVVEPEVLEGLPHGTPLEFVPEILIPAIQAHKAGVFLKQGAWFDIGSPQLWSSAHFELMEGISIHPLFASQPWVKRVQEFNQQIAPQVWISKRSLLPSGFSGPLYWDARKDPSFCPRALGPSVVLYGEMDRMIQLTEGIGFDGKWVHFS